MTLPRHSKPLNERWLSTATERFEEEWMAGTMPPNALAKMRHNATATPQTVEPGQVWECNIGHTVLRYHVIAVEDGRATFEEKVTYHEHDGATVRHMLSAAHWHLVEG